MFSSLIKRTFRLMMPLVLLWGVGLRAQLNTAYQTTPTTDFLDIFQSSNYTAIKPEIVTLFDFSGSMNQVMFHGSFPNWFGGNGSGGLQDNEGPPVNYNFIITVAKVGTVYVVSNVQMVNDKNNTTNVTSFRIADDAASIKAPYANAFSVTATYTVAAPPVTDATNAPNGYALIKPNGDIVTQADALTASSAVTNAAGGLYGYKNATDGYTDARNWVRCASHLRVAFTNSEVAGVKRTVDIPLHWAILTKDSTGKPLSTLTTTDPKTTTVYELDSTHLDAPSGLTTLGAWSNSVSTASLGTNAAVSSAIVGSAGNVHAWREDYLAWVFFGKDKAGAGYVIPEAVSSTAVVNASGVAFKNGLPNRDRVQAVKEAAIKTWLQYQDKVVWAFRGLDGAEDTTSGSVDPSVSFTDSSNTSVPTNNTTSGGSRVWCVLNGNTDKGVKRLAKLVANTGTPLNESVGNTLAQFAVNGSTAFKAFETGTNAPSDCLKHFLIVFTDGAPNSTNHNTEGGLKATYDPAPPTNGNNLVKADITKLDPPTASFSSSRWNMPTLAGVAAWGGDANYSPLTIPASYPTVSSTLSSFAPFWVKSRVNGGTGATFTFSKPHPIKVMTAGVSLGNGYDSSGNQLAIQSDSVSPKYRLFAAAVFGDPGNASYNISTAIPYNGSASANQAFFFDCQDPDTLVAYLSASFLTAITDTGNQEIATPVTPLSGLALSNQVYLTNFVVPQVSGPIWSGDLLSFFTKANGSQVQLLSNTGAVIDDLTPSAAATLAQWSGNKIIVNKGYGSRKVYTRIPATVAAPTPGLIPFESSGSNFTAISPFLPSSYTSTQKQSLVDWMRGQDPSAPANTRNPLMGDIVDSTPAVIEFSLSYLQSGGISLPASLSGAVTAHQGDSSAHFRLIFVGTNTGFLHCFGELRYDTKDPVTGAVTSSTVIADELWSFVPTDFLAYLDQLRVASNPHRFMVDGAPFCYLLDIPQSGKTYGNGIFDGGQERAVVIFGLGKGGRSYYAIDIKDPMNPKMAWSLSSEESATIPATRIKLGTTAAVQGLVSKMGFSTSQVSVGRLLYGGSSPTLKDVVFLGGGLSEWEIENKSFAGAKLGRNAFAMDAYTGDILMTWDFSGVTGMGSLNSGIVPFSIYQNSGLVQRAYFTDYYGGLWALGSGQSGNGITAPFRTDYSQLDRWTSDGSVGTSSPGLRHVYQGPSNELQSTLPAPFNVTAFPVFRTTAPIKAPDAVGIAQISGDRNNPVDQLYGTPVSTTTPRGARPASGHRLTVVFDREDGTALGIEPITLGQMTDMTGQSTVGAPIITPGNAAYYLKSTYGWFSELPDPTVTGYIPKGINPPTVITNVLFYTYFYPTSGGTCVAGKGNSSTFRVCNIMAPVLSSTDVDPGTSCLNGKVGQWSSVASNFNQRGTVAVTQGGTVIGTDPSNKGSNLTTIETMVGSNAQRFPQPRVWRTVH